VIIESLLGLGFGYLLGSVPYGLLITRAAGTADIRTIGSQNIGATNVLRTGRKDLAIATLLCDALKGTLAILIAGYFARDAGIAAALGAFLGHIFPVWLGFKGGKGVATFIGCLFGLYWPAGLLFALIWIGVAAITRYSSAAALVASAASPVALYALGKPNEAAIFAVMTVLLFIMHRQNISRLLAGTESKIGRASS
jgi:glycerol-3-phosphate acyltransferase PlsY